MPRAIDLFCGLGGWTEGLRAEGYDVTGYDIEAHEYGEQKYPATLVLRDVLTIHGSEFADADLIVASPPCQAYSYMAMPWSRAKQIAAALRGTGEFPEAYTGPRTVTDLNALFNACFCIQREACEAAGRYIPMVVENVKGAQPWVGPAKAHFGSFYLWGDVEMVGDRVIAGGLRWDSVRAAKRGAKIPGQNWSRFIDEGVPSPHWNMQAVKEDGRKVEGFNFHEHAKTGKPGRSFQSAAVALGAKGVGSWFGDYKEMKAAGRGAANRTTSSNSKARKAASAQIAKIPLPLSSYIARAYRP